MTKIRMWAYSVGHMMNDLTVAMYFVYLTFYIVNVLRISTTIGAGAVLSGQAADGLTTPIVGFLSDRFEPRCGKRTLFFILGTLMVLPGYLGMFISPPYINDPVIDESTGL